MNTKLPDFLRHAAAQPFILGTFDCGLWLADWKLFAIGGVDPAAPWRGAYHDEAGFKALGFPLVIARAFDRAGVPRTSDPLPGDVAIIRNKPGREAIGAIRSKKGWAILAIGGGVSVLPPSDSIRTMAAWRI